MRARPPARGERGLKRSRGSEPRLRTDTHLQTSSTRSVRAMKPSPASSRLSRKHVQIRPPHPRTPWATAGGTSQGTEAGRGQRSPGLGQSLSVGPLFTHHQTILLTWAVAANRPLRWARRALGYLAWLGPRGSPGRGGHSPGPGPQASACAGPGPPRPGRSGAG